jgi:hypothetical protein
MTKHSLWVTTARFEVAIPGEHFINPRCFGEDFAHWLRGLLLERGIDVDEPIQEDWGWILLAKMQSKKLTISIGVLEDSIGAVPAVWKLDVEFEKVLNGIRAWFTRIPEEPARQLITEIRDALSEESGISVSDTEP